MRDRRIAHDDDGDFDCCEYQQQVERRKNEEMVQENESLWMWNYVDYVDYSEGCSEDYLGYLGYFGYFGGDDAAAYEGC